MSSAPITSISLQGKQVDILRLELEHPDVQGNKWYKLKYNLQFILDNGYKSIMTFGGVFSNHLHAIAGVCKENGIKAIAVLRGENDEENPTLKYLRSMDVECLFINREMYRMRNMPDFIAQLSAQFGNVYVLPEGGTNELAVKGCSEILQGLETKYDHILCAVGTGGTMAGIISTPGLTANVIGVSALKTDKDTISPVIRSFIPDNNTVDWKLYFDDKFGGFGQYHGLLHQYLDAFKTTHGILLDPMYTGKLMYKTEQLISSGELTGNRILCIHSGGLQGWEGWYYRYANKYNPQD